MLSLFSIFKVFHSSHRWYASSILNISLCSHFFLSKIIESCHLELKFFKYLIVMFNGRIRCISFCTISWNLARILSYSKIIIIHLLMFIFNESSFTSWNKCLNILAILDNLIHILSWKSSLTSIVTSTMCLKGQILILSLSLFRQTRLWHGIWR